MFSRVNSSGFQDHIASGGLRASQANQLDINMSNAVDGYEGGTYVLSAKLILSGTQPWVFAGNSGVYVDGLSTGGDTCHYSTGVLYAAAPLYVNKSNFNFVTDTAGLITRVDTTTIPTSGSAYLDASADEYLLTSAFVGHVTLRMVGDADDVTALGGRRAEQGEVVRISKRNKDNSFSIYVYRGESTTSKICQLDQSNTWADLMYTDDGWTCFRWGDGTTQIDYK